MNWFHNQSISVWKELMKWTLAKTIDIYIYRVEATCAHYTNAGTIYIDKNPLNNKELHSIWKNGEKNTRWNNVIGDTKWKVRWPKWKRWRTAQLWSHDWAWLFFPRLIFVRYCFPLMNINTMSDNNSSLRCFSWIAEIAALMIPKWNTAAGPYMENSASNGNYETENCVWY